MLKEFKEFILKGNLIEIAVGLILALKFKDVIDSFTNGIISPIIGAIVGKPSFDNTLGIGDGELLVGAFITTLITFVITGAVLFLIVKAYNRAVSMSRRGEIPEEATEQGEDVMLLREIRDSLRARP
ncbi:MAG: large conductance mechanosensitive channel protein MscL [Acidimicrobiales bacterium]